ncbi:unnamed protein product, partial [Darwinula stevensoni]
TYRHRGLRRQLIDSLREKGIHQEDILAAFNAIPRHFFLDKAFEEWAYQDKAFPIGYDQTISQPYTVAYQTALLKVEPKDKVLEIGTGSGYQAAVLAYLGAKVFTLERQEALYEKSRQLLAKLGFANVRVVWKDGYEGLEDQAPFDKILVTAGATEKPQVLLNQLKIGGYMVIPIGNAKVQQMYRITRLSEIDFEDEIFDDFERVDWILKQSVDIFVLELGGNDALRGIKPEESYKNLQSIIDKVRTKYPQAKIILAGMQAPPNMGVAFTKAFREIYPKLAKENNIALIPFLLEGVGGISKLNLPDGIHPTPQGHKIVAE